MAARAFKVWYAADKKLVSATSLDELINKGLTKLHKTRENFKGLRLSDGTDVDDDELLPFLELSEPIHFVFSDEAVPSTSTYTGASDHQQTTEGGHGVHSLPSTPITRTPSNVSVQTHPPTPPPPHVTTPAEGGHGVHSLPSTPITRTPSNVSFLTPPPTPPTPHVTTPVEVQQSDMAQSTTTQSTTLTHDDFVKAPMGEKNVQAIAGIGPSIGKKLKAKGYLKAYNVLGKYLVLHKNEALFTEWLKEEGGAKDKQGADCYRCLKEWCVNYLVLD